MKKTAVLLLSFLVGLGLQCCESRFNKFQRNDSDAFDQFDRELIVNTEYKFSSRSIDDVIQYLKIQEKVNWETISQGEVEEYLKKHSNQPELLELASDFYLSQDDLERALFYNSKAESNGAKSVEFYKKRAKILTAIGKYGLAIDYLNKAVMLNSNDPDMYLLKGDVYLKLGDSTSALKYKEQAFSNDSSRKDIGVDLAHIYATTNKYEDALVMADLMISKNVETELMTYLKAEVFRKLEKDDYANNLLANQLNAGDATAGELLIYHFKGINEYDSMIFYSSKVLAIDSLNPLSLQSKAMAFDKKGFFSSSLMYYEQLLALDSLNKEALEGIGKVKGKIAYLRKLREQREAIPTFDFASPRNETN